MADTLARLSLKQQRFVDAYLIDGNATKAAIAAGYGEAGAAVQGVRLLRNVKVMAVLASQRTKASESAGLTLQSHLDTLNDLRTKAAGAEQFAAAVTAEVSRGKASGFYVEHKKHEFTGPLEVRVKFVREGRRITAS